MESTCHSCPISLLWARQLRRENGHLLKRIQDTEQGFKKYANSLALLGERIDGQPLERILGQLDSLTKSVKVGEEQIKSLLASNEKLESSNTGLKKANEKLVEELKTRNSGSIVEFQTGRSRRTIQQDDMEVPALSHAGSLGPKTPRDWFGNRYDSEVIDEGPALAENATALTKSALNTREPDEITRGLSRPTKKSTQKLAIPKAQFIEGVQKSHEPAGSQAERKIIAAAESLARSRKNTRTSSVASEESSAKRPRQIVEDKYNRRSGRGFVEVEEQVGDDTADNLPANQPVGRPRRDIAQPRSGSQGMSTLPKRSSRLPTLRKEEAELVRQEPLARQTRAQKKIKIEEANSAIPPPDCAQIKRRIQQRDEELL